MIFRFVTLLVGYGFAVSGGIGLIAYLGLLTAGYSFGQYMLFLVKKSELYFFICGSILILLAIYCPNRSKK